MSIRVGKASEQIIVAADEIGDVMIVMTTHGRGGVSRWVFGSVAERVVRGSGSPVLLIRSGATRAEPTEIRSILVPLDGSDYAEAALPYATDLARTFDAELRLVRVAETGQLYRMVGRESIAPTAVDTLTDLAERMVQDAERYLTATAEQLRSQGLQVQIQTLEGFAADQLLAYERDQAIDLVVMATHAREGLSRVVFGSVAERMLRLGATPVMMIRPPEAEAGEADAEDAPAAVPGSRDDRGPSAAPAR